MRRRPVPVLPVRPAGLLGLALLLACGGGGGSNPSGGSVAPPAPPALTARETQALVDLFLASEGHPNLVTSYLGASAPVPVLPAAALALPDCAQATVERTSLTSARITLVLTDCARGGSTVSGKVVIQAQALPPAASVSFDPLSAHAGTRSWVVDGTKGFSANPGTREYTVNTTNLRIAYTDSADPASNRTFTYDCSLTASAATAGEVRVWGTFSFRSSDGTSVSGSIAKDQALLWTAGCCYPTAGTLHLVKGSASADATFGPACGTLKLQPAGGTAETRTLASCS